MALEYPRYGTRISLSDRFALIRKEANKRALLVNQSIDKKVPLVNLNKNAENFNNTVSRSDRPSAALQQGSERNKRLVLQMAVAPSVLAEINHTYNTQIRAQIPKIPQKRLALLKPKNRSIKQRLGAVPNGTPPRGNVKSRLGINRKPISQRLGIPAAQNGSLNNGNRLFRKNYPIFKNKSQAPQFTQTRIIHNRKKGGNPIPMRKPFLPPQPVTAQQLDADLDVYMKNTKGFLNSDLDAYMSARI